jgi:hypothetical protein
MKSIAVLSGIFLSVAAWSQVRISGTVSDLKGQPIPGVNIILKDTYDGASSAADGRFSFDTDHTGEQVLMATFVGYKSFERGITLGTANIVVSVELQETFSELNAVTITAGAFSANDASRRTIFRPLDIATTAGATADIAGALNTLPGTQKVGEEGRLFVRGGDGRETRTFIDGGWVLDAYNVSAPNTPSRGRFLPFMFKGTSFSTGGYSAEYGQALSSALVLDSHDKAELTRTDIGLLSVGADVSHTQAWERSSLAAKVQYTNLRPYMSLIDQEIDWVRPPLTMEGIGVFRQQLGEQGLVKFYGNFTQTDFALVNHAIDDYSQETPYDLRNDYRYGNGSAQTPLNDNWSLRGSMAYAYIRNVTTAGTQRIDDTNKGYHAKAVLEGSVAEKIELKAGVEVIGQDFRRGLQSPSGDKTRALNSWIFSGFTEADLYANNNFVARVGARTEYDQNSGAWSVDPRISIAGKLGRHGQTSLAYGIFRQAPDVNHRLENQQLQSEQASHFILNYQLIEDNRTFRAEAYYKHYDHLVKFPRQDFSNSENSGNGYATGFEVFWRDNRTFRNIDYWISYSYLDTERDYLNYPVGATPSFASAHNFSAVYKHFVPRLKTQFGATYSLASPRPYNDPNSNTFNGGRTPFYADLSLNLSYLPKNFLIIHFSCTNVLGRDNIFGYEFSATPDTNGVYAGRPVRQAAPRFLFIGVFITLSRDKTLNQLPTL